MEELIKKIEEVRERINKFADKLSSNEALTRYILIDPILRALGWNLENPDEVVVEDSTISGKEKHKRADYVLYYEGKPRMIIEAKALGKVDQDSVEQAISYAIYRGIDYALITDGNIWRLYKTFESGKSTPERLQLSIELRNELSGKAARSLLALWKPAMPFIEEVPEPVVETEEKKRDLKPTDRETCRRTLKDLLSQSVKFRQPTGKLIYQGREENVNSWKQVLVAISKWVLKELERKGNLPLRKPRGGMLIDKNLDPKVSNPLDLNYRVYTWLSAEHTVRYISYILEKAEVDPSEICFEGELRQWKK